MDKKRLNILLDRIKNEKWRLRGMWHASPLYLEIYGEGESTKYQQKLNFPFCKTFGIWTQDGAYLDLQREWDAVAQQIRSEYRKDDTYLFHYAENCLKMGDDLLDLSKLMGKTPLPCLSKSELVGMYSQVIQSCKEMMPYMFSLHLVDLFLTEVFEKKFKIYCDQKGFDQDQYFDFISAITLPDRKIFVLEEKSSLMRMACYIKAHQMSMDSELVKRKIAQHTKKHGWIGMVLMEEKPYGEVVFMRKLQKLLRTDIEHEYKTYRKQERSLRLLRGRIMKDIESIPHLYNLAMTVQLFGFLRSFRNDVVHVALFNIWPIIVKITTLLKIKVLDIKYLDANEVHQALLGKLPYKDIIAERKKAFVGIMAGNDRYVFTGDVAHLISRSILLNDQEERLDNSFRGSVAFPGIIRGTCRVLKSTKDMRKMKQGDVLVISMTDPNYIPAMEKASAFVTDQGGILCHAAIVSREMKKPCIIGTKVATKVLKDGMLVEVDANKGVVTII